jgi:hypothetical protein
VRRLFVDGGGRSAHDRPVSRGAARWRRR